MSKQIVLSPVSSEAETVCTTCRYFTELEGGFFCSFFAAFLSAESLFIPCDFLEKIEDSS
jgi:hypothetical protein